jgi:integral membrane sensor domain MASE1
VTKIIILALAYAGTGWLGLQMPYAGSHITLVWLPTGIAVAALIRLGWAIWPGIFIGALLANLSVGSSWPLAAGIAVSNTLGPLLTRGLLRRTGFHAAFDRQRDIGLFIAASAVGMTVSAAGGCMNLYLAGWMPLQDLGTTWLSWWMGDTVGVLLAGPLLVTLTWESLAQLGRARNALLLWIVVTGLALWFVFVYDYGQLGHALPLAFLTLPLIA